MGGEVDRWAGVCGWIRGGGDRPWGIIFGAK